ncbi:hypothetical protein ABID82_002318 [Methylobacterium sp. PvP062]|jgi:hypothetical protein|uniref:Uncharacterized protein n=2 Tax=Methylobacterium radiotolerans TaxID=31998 RepID=B1LZW9_METRJ|nr:MULTISPECIES: hypothetical protein [Methylobacterium]MCX7335788.1 hypothetical protein [Hyphomicrobiales bacterium]GAN50314.1 hypothetical protein ME121_4355 [Methylobacterium sp. ME121]ACB24452.1 hypothetical protein Mrad2831_2457 [Methylobacterium radiotolerans JCM 2831]KIU33701.1 hypothetical protein SR39_12535 [Methylobacterium radiotolerans]KZC01714.1 hypothetical protein AU375_02017 [Methylobacterium radiotolerans]
MPSGLGFPLAMASLFTLGWIVIQKAGTRTEAVAEGLGALFLLSALLAVVALLAAFGNGHATGLVLMRSVSAG